MGGTPPLSASLDSTEKSSKGKLRFELIDHSESDEEGRRKIFVPPFAVGRLGLFLLARSSRSGHLFHFHLYPGLLSISSPCWLVAPLRAELWYLHRPSSFSSSSVRSCVSFGRTLFTTNNCEFSFFRTALALFWRNACSWYASCFKAILVCFCPSINPFKSEVCSLLIMVAFSATFRIALTSIGCSILDSTLSLLLSNGLRLTIWYINCEFWIDRASFIPSSKVAGLLSMNARNVRGSVTAWASISINSVSKNSSFLSCGVYAESANNIIRSAKDCMDSFAPCLMHLNVCRAVNPVA